MLFKSLHSLNGLITRLIREIKPCRWENKIQLPSSSEKLINIKSPTMEISNDTIQTEPKAKPKGRAKTWKPPTRLQAHAPASLQLDQMTFSASTSINFLPTTDTSKAIPLLSPLVLSPQPSQETTEELICGFDRSYEQQQDGMVDKMDVRGSPDSGWQHPAVVTFADPSTLFSFFQSQCRIVNQAQWFF